MIQKDNFYNLFDDIFAFLSTIESDADYPWPKGFEPWALENEGADVAPPTAKENLGKFRDMIQKKRKGTLYSWLISQLYLFYCHSSTLSSLLLLLYCISFIVSLIPLYTCIYVISILVLYVLSSIVSLISVHTCIYVVSILYSMLYLCSPLYLQSVSLNHLMLFSVESLIGDIFNDKRKQKYANQLGTY